MEWISKIKHWSLYKQWRKRIAGEPMCDYEKGAGYYSVRNRKTVWDMVSGQRMKVICIGHQKFYDPPDMIKKSQWQFIGYTGGKPFAEMSWTEYLKYYLQPPTEKE